MRIKNFTCKIVRRSFTGHEKAYNRHENATVVIQNPHENRPSDIYQLKNRKSLLSILHVQLFFLDVKVQKGDIDVERQLIDSASTDSEYYS